MGTTLLYQTDAYLRTFRSTVQAVDGEVVALEETAFYPSGGGQPHDLGSLTSGLQTWRVVQVERDGFTVWHKVEGDPPLVGTTVVGEVDWVRRYALMRTHTALHILCGVVWRDYGARVTSANMEPLRGRLDFEFETLHGELVRELEEKINAAVAAAHPVRVYFLPREEADTHPDLIHTRVNLLPQEITEIRVIEIEGLDVQADGGTHVANTQEVGRVRVVNYKSKGRINKRIEIVVEDEQATW